MHATQPLRTVPHLTMLTKSQKIGYRAGKSLRTRILSISGPYMKRCKGCAIWHTEMDFSPCGPASIQRSAQCKQCDAARSRRYHRKHPEKGYNRLKSRNLRFKYGLTQSGRDALYDKQCGLCAICQSPCPRYADLVIDHCHITGTIRGLLCANCNTGIGMFRDNADHLKAAIEYLGRHRYQWVQSQLSPKPIY